MSSMRYAEVRGVDSERQLAAYLPGNYEIIAYVPGTDERYYVGGVDSCGWTLEDYVIPRLASGLIWATEVPEDAVPVRFVR